MVSTAACNACNLASVKMKSTVACSHRLPHRPSCERFAKTSSLLGPEQNLRLALVLATKNSQQAGPAKGHDSSGISWRTCQTGNLLLEPIDIEND